LSIRNIDNTDASDPHGFVEEYGKGRLGDPVASSAPVVLGGSGFTISRRN
jgi:hypothetical protein